MARARAATVFCSASTCTCNPTSRAVAAVIGPIQAITVLPTNRTMASCDTKRSAKFRTVEELVKEMTSIARVSSCSMSRSEASAGRIVLYTGTTSTVAPRDLNSSGKISRATKARGINIRLPRT